MGESPAETTPKSLACKLGESSPVVVVTDTVQFLSSETLQKPLGSIRKIDVANKSGIEIPRILGCFYNVEHIWKFQLDEHLRLNITFEYVQFSLMNFHGCATGNVSVKETVFCGMHSGMSFFPRQPVIQVLLSAKPNVAFQTKYDYSVIDCKTLFTATSIKKVLFHSHLVLPRQPSWRTYVYHSDIIIATYHIAAEKYQRIKVTVLKLPTQFCVVHDGPAADSKQIKHKRTEGNSSIHKTTGFHCFAQIHGWLTYSSFTDTVLETKVVTSPIVLIHPLWNWAHL